jgi:hypothetical protein
MFGDNYDKSNSMHDGTENSELKEYLLVYGA